MGEQLFLIWLVGVVVCIVITNQIVKNEHSARGKWIRLRWGSICSLVWPIAVPLGLIAICLNAYLHWRDKRSND